jgi:hypothetical protein
MLENAAWLFIKQEFLKKYELQEPGNMENGEGPVYRYS